jgi:hypothetical protein
MGTEHTSALDTVNNLDNLVTSDGIPSRCDREPNPKKLTKHEKSFIIEHIIDLDSRGFAPKSNAIANMANKLLTDRAGPRFVLRLFSAEG